VAKMKIKYKGINNSGMVKEGVIEAKSINEAEEKLSLQGFSNLKLEVITGKSNLSLPFIKGRVKERDLAIFTRQSGALINAGVGIAEGLEILSEELPNKTLSTALKEIKEDVVAGMSLSKAMEKHRNVFPDFLIHLTSAAEESGSLDVVLMRATVYFEKIAAIKRKIVSASWYPTAVIIIASLIVLGILTFVVPTFAQLYAGFGAKLPFLTQIIIDASNFIKGNFLILLGVVIGFFLINSYIYRTPAGKEFYHRMFLRLPLLGEIFRKGAVAKFARTLATLVSGGVPIIRALEIASKVSGNVVIEKSILKTKDDVERGRQIYQSLDTKVFPPIFIAMVRVGENTGRLDEMLDTIAEFFEDEVDRAVEGLLSLIEPLLMVFIGGVVGLIIIALYLPIFKVGELLT
jgi:type IV pilus assembly protein PilC